MKDGEAETCISEIEANGPRRPANVQIGFSDCSYCSKLLVIRIFWDFDCAAIPAIVYFFDAYGASTICLGLYWARVRNQRGRLSPGPVGNHRFGLWCSHTLAVPTHDEKASTKGQRRGRRRIPGQRARSRNGRVRGWEKIACYDIAFAWLCWSRFVGAAVLRVQKQVAPSY